MSEPGSTNHSQREQGEREVLTNLPQTRPQRSSVRRDAARRTRSAAAASAKTAPPAKKHPRADQARDERAADVAGKAPAATPKRRVAERAKRAQPAARAKQEPRQRPARQRARAGEPQVPRQGFESDRDVRVGASVEPPSGRELLGSLAELVGEVTQSGLSSGGRLLRDVMSRLPRP